MSGQNNICICGSLKHDVISGIKGHNIYRCWDCGAFYSDKKSVVHDLKTIDILMEYGSVERGILSLPKIRGQGLFVPSIAFKVLSSHFFLESLSNPLGFLENVWRGHEEIEIQGESYSTESEEFKKYGFGASWFIPHRILWYWGPTCFDLVMKRWGIIGKIHKINENIFSYSIRRNRSE